MIANYKKMQAFNSDESKQRAVGNEIYASCRYDGSFALLRMTIGRVFVRRMLLWCLGRLFGLFVGRFGGFLLLGICLRRNGLRLVVLLGLLVLFWQRFRGSGVASFRLVRRV